ncbi:hypothetical protein ACO0LD_17950 [Undibacterium sp. Ji83W]|uniref:hypothetical protein n=1 Tax=Undibacterium sp. Ji83W TaxID=3413043 RepID=UPI003BF05B06
MKRSNKITQFKFLSTIFFSFFLLSGCSTTYEFKTTRLEQQVNIRGKKLYVYSFLDVRENDLGMNLIAHFDSGLIKELAIHEVSAKVLPFRSSRIGSDYSFTQRGMKIPVNESIQDNVRDESRFQPNYRLVVFPAQVTTAVTYAASSHVQSSQITWQLFDATTNTLIWSGTLAESSAMSGRGRSDDSTGKERAADIITKFINALKKDNLL